MSRSTRYILFSLSFFTTENTIFVILNLYQEQLLLHCGCNCFRNGIKVFFTMFNGQYMFKYKYRPEQSFFFCFFFCCKFIIHLLKLSPRNDAYLTVLLVFKSPIWKSLAILVQFIQGKCYLFKWGCKCLTLMCSWFVLHNLHKSNKSSSL